jgi:hypothetical protein
MPPQTAVSKRSMPAILLRTLLAATVVAAMCAGRADASQNLVSIIQDDPAITTNPAATLMTMRQLGATQLRLAVVWENIAPSPNSFKRPKFNASNPAAYSASKWAPIDTAVRDATADGIEVNFNVVGGAPIWATGPNMPKGKGYPHHNWAPNATQYGMFMHALGVRYSGNYDPVTKRVAPGNSADLPRVSFWSVWNEPDYDSLAPQALPGVKGPVEDSPRLYRLLLDAAWTALHQTGHGSDIVLFGEVAPRNKTLATNLIGNFNGMWPMQWIRNLYCLAPNYKELRGKAATLRGCPANAAGSAKFAAQNPALFKASGFADHPYMDWYAPNHESIPSPNGTSLPEIRNLENGLNRIVRIYGSHKVFPIWNTEFGYITSPPKRPNPGVDTHPWPSQATAAYWDNWAEYISWKDPRIASFAQYTLRDSYPAIKKYDYGEFASGLINYNGTPKPGFAAWRMPFFLPKTTFSQGVPLEVWGDLRPEHYVSLDLPYSQESVKILFKASGTQTFSPLDVVPIRSKQGYFDTEVTFPSTGTVELSWTYPTDPLLGLSGQTVYSRQVEVTLG